MNPFIQLALRNASRNRRRSLMTIAVITIGVTFIFSVSSMLNGLQKEMREGMTQAEIGEIQIVKKGFREALPSKALDYLFVYDDELKQIVLSAPNVTAAAPRLTMAGMINHQKSQTTTPFFGIAVDPEAEDAVCPRLRELLPSNSGSWIDASKERDVILDNDLTTGLSDASVDEKIDFSRPGAMIRRDLPSSLSEYHQVLIGQSMRDGFKYLIGAENKFAETGDELIIMTMDRDGAQRSLKADISGVLNSRNPTASKSIVYLALPTAQRLMSAEGKINTLVLALDESSKRFETSSYLNEVLKDKGLIAQPWDDINTFFKTIFKLQDSLFGIITVIISIFVIVAISITSMMTVAERTREIGTLMAIGWKRRQILTIFLIESAAIGVTGALAGMSIGSAIIAAGGWIGIDFIIPGTDAPIVLRPFISQATVLSAAMLGLFSGIIGSFFPARSASRLSPVEAMSHV